MATFWATFWGWQMSLFFTYDHLKYELKQLEQCKQNLYTKLFIGCAKMNNFVWCFLNS